MDNPTAILAALAALVFVGLLAEELFRRTGIPDVLLLLALGFAASATGLVRLDAIAGLDRVLTTAALAFILFEGAVRLRLSELRQALGPTLVLTFASFVGTAVAIGLVAWALFGMRLGAGLLLGTILAGTSSAVVIPMVQALKVEKRTRTTLVLESALSDVLCVVFALAIVGALSAGELSVRSMASSLVGGFAGALLLGGVAGVAWAVGLRMLRAHRASLVALGAVVFLIYAGAELLMMPGAIACLAFGVALGNAPAMGRGRVDPATLELSEGERFFLSEMAFLLKVFFFVYLGAALDLSGYEPFVFGGLATLAAYALRPLAVRAALGPAGTPRYDAVVASVLIPKGLAAAVLAGLPRQAGIAEGADIERTTYGVVLMTIVAGAALVFLARRPFVQGAYARVFGGYSDAPAPPSTGTAGGGAPAAL